MIITGSSVFMAATRIYTERQTIKEELNAWAGNRDTNPAREAIQGDPAPGGEQLSISDEADACLCLERPEKTEENPGDQLDPRWMVVKRLVEKLTGKKIRLLTLSELRSCDQEKPGLRLEQEKAEERGNPERPHGWGIEYHYNESYYEHEEVSFTAQGTIQTQDGKEVRFSVNLNLSREYMSETSFTILAGDAARKVDPLVVNFGGAAPELTSMKFTFDLNADGINEQVPFLKPGSGFFVVDANKDGVVNNGSELFGPQTGNGFEELAAHDRDGNNWIDENDPVYMDLLIWTKDADGSDVLSSLKEKGIGAIYLGNLNTTFSLKGFDNLLTGQLNRFGIYLNEDGIAGTVQQLDIVV